MITKANASVFKFEPGPDSVIETGTQERLAHVPNLTCAYSCDVHPNLTKIRSIDAHEKE